MGTFKKGISIVDVKVIASIWSVDISTSLENTFQLAFERSIKTSLVSDIIVSHSRWRPMIVRISSRRPCNDFKYKVLDRPALERA